MSENGEEQESSEVVGSAKFEIPEELLQILPSDPFEQLDMARKITSIALSTRVSALESESSDLWGKLAERDRAIAELQSQVESLEASLSDAFEKLSRSDREKESLLMENASLSSTARKLQRDVSKLESFRKTLMQSLREDEENAGTAQIIAKPTPNDSDSPLPPSRHPQDPEGVDVPKPDFRLVSPRLSPPGSPLTISASASPTRTSRQLSPKRHAMSFSTSRGMLEGRSSFSEAGSYTGRTRVDGKEFFRQVRSRLSYEQFGAFVGNVKELNAQKQSKQETLRKAEEILGVENKDLYLIFDGLVNRNFH